MSILLKHGVLARIAPPAAVTAADLRIEGGEIVAAGKHLRARPGEQVHDLRGALVLPGNVCAHTHLYSSLSRGMPAPRSAPRTFREILQKIWWKLDCALDEEAIYYSALVGAVEALKSGTTTIIDHHASPNAIAGSLDLVKQALDEAGLRGILCYETTDRGGWGRRDAALEENERFVRSQKRSGRFRGTIGAHASFTLGDDTLRRLGELAESYGCGVHIHVAESAEDGLDAQRNHGKTVMSRLREILSGKTILAHGVHLSKRELQVASNSGSWLVHNPRSNMNNQVGYAPLQWFGRRSALGTDGFPADMFEESRIGFFRAREARTVPFGTILSLGSGGQELASEFFGRRFGGVQAGSPADLLVVEYHPPTPLTAKNIQAHLLFGVTHAMVRHVMVDGRWVLRDRTPVTIDEEKIMREAACVARRLWRKVA